MDPIEGARSISTCRLRKNIGGVRMLHSAFRDNAPKTMTAAAIAAGSGAPFDFASSTGACAGQPAYSRDSISRIFR